MFAQLGYPYPYGADGNGGPPVLDQLRWGVHAAEAGRLGTPEPLYPRLETEVAADISIQVDYPQPLQRVADNVRAAVREAITDLVGMKVAEINVTVVDVFIPGDDDEDDQTDVRVN